MHLDQDLLKHVSCLQDSESSVATRDYVDMLHHVLCHFRDHFNAYLVAHRPSSVPSSVLDNASCTLCMCIRFAITAASAPVVFAINIGDSSMVMLDPLTDSVLPVWSTDAIAHPACPAQARARARYANPAHTPLPRSATHLTAAYQDSVSAAPEGVEGQHAGLLAHDLAMIRPFVLTKQATTGKGSAASHADRLLAAPGTLHRLRMTNALGNLDHHRSGAFVPRTTVYRLDRAAAALPRDALLVLMTDGVRDVVKDSPTLVAVARALREGPEAGARLVDAWAAATHRHMHLVGARARVTGGDAGTSRTRTARVATQLVQIARVFASPTHQASAKAVAAAQRVAQILTLDTPPGDTEYLRLVAECLVQVAVLRGTMDDATCLVWKVGQEQETLGKEWWAVSAAALHVVRTEE